jgi:hypothetical protein
MPHPDDEYRKRCFAEFDSLGESLVRMKITNKQWNSEPLKYGAAESWFECKRQEREAIASEKRDSREDRTLALAAASNELAKEANDFARASNAIAAEASKSARLANSIASRALEAERRQAKWAKIAAIVAAIAIANDIWPSWLTRTWNVLSDWFNSS